MGTLTTASNSSVLVVNGARDCNIFWQVGSSATLGTTTTFKGSIVALTSITLNSGVTVSGRVLARNAAVTMDTNALDAKADACDATTLDSGTVDSASSSSCDGAAPIDTGVVDSGIASVCDGSPEIDTGEVDACDAGSP